MKLKVYIRYDIINDCMDLFLVKDDPNGKRLIGKTSELTFEPANHLVPNEPTFRFPSYEAKDFLNALAEALAESGYKPPIEENRGELRAMKCHIEDLRKLVIPGAK